LLDANNCKRMYFFLISNGFRAVFYNNYVLTLQWKYKEIFELFIT
jgi:hypothetical protein